MGQKSVQELQQMITELQRQVRDHENRIVELERLAKKTRTTLGAQGIIVPRKRTV